MKESMFINGLIGSPAESLLASRRRSQRSMRIEVIVRACQKASEDDIKLIERILRINDIIQ